MFQKIIGITGAVAVFGVIVMAAVSPRAEGFFPDMFDFLRRKPPVETPLPQTLLPTVPTAGTTDLSPADTLPADIPEAHIDSVAAE